MRSVVRRGPVALVLLMLSGPLAVGPAMAATLYKWVDAQGVVHYSDTPHEGAEKLQVSGAQTFHETPSAASGAQSPGSAAKPRYSSCQIVQPGGDAALYAPETVDVTVQTEPALQAGDSIAAAMDGQALNGDGSGHFRIEQPERGEHTISAQVFGADGTVVCSAQSVSFSVQRPSLNSPQSPARGH